MYAPEMEPAPQFEAHEFEAGMKPVEYDQVFKNRTTLFHILASEEDELVVKVMKDEMLEREYTEPAQCLHKIFAIFYRNLACINQMARELEDVSDVMCQYLDNKKF